MQITLNKKTYTATGVKAIKVREALILHESSDFNNIDSRTLDKMADYVVSLYDKQFTRKQLYEGLKADELITTLVGNMSTVIAGVTDILDTFPEERRVRRAGYVGKLVKKFICKLTGK